MCGRSEDTNTNTLIHLLRGGNVHALIIQHPFTFTAAPWDIYFSSESHTPSIGRACLLRRRQSNAVMGRGVNDSNIYSDGIGDENQGARLRALGAPGNGR